MTDAFVIETEDRAAGIAVRDAGGFRFFASDTLFTALDNLRFRSLHDVQACVDAIVNGKGPPVSEEIAYADELTRKHPFSPP